LAKFFKKALSNPFNEIKGTNDNNIDNNNDNNDNNNNNNNNDQP